MTPKPNETPWAQRQKHLHLQKSISFSFRPAIEICKTYVLKNHEEKSIAN